MRRITIDQFHREKEKRAKDPAGGQLTLYRLVGDGYVGELPIALVIPSPNPMREPFLVHRLRNEHAVRALIDSLNDALREEAASDPRG